MRVADRWLTIREAAALIPGMSQKRMRRRLLALHSQHPERGLLRRPGVRWFEVSAEALQRALTTDPGLSAGDVGDVESRVRVLEQRQVAHRDRQARMEKRLKAAEAKITELEAELVTLRAKVGQLAGLQDIQDFATATIPR